MLGVQILKLQPLTSGLYCQALFTTVASRRNWTVGCMTRKQTMISAIPCGLVARICGFHPQGPGSIPGMGKYLICYFY
ncbi:hypothetical protein T4B_7164 [Trichinella pseudospiralis]|uniref:Uncharacterized protein n=2 Tax=Trichinella pseudospiralis TaxID=6337 RepID=A0A0V1FE01_TRIPS|nr:hypothetical protein T4A_14199 [Trichinella pseudospiralis]KRY84283.1 hypothetical protein T4D_1087 [Trichinella pseudospiralis]KRZ20594.1 hypothetical protein T4B_7164 [Trichinella pseudospiralis]KRZ35834.1 hypothetical protein T4C_13562 [Trichinella pseudospiralis]